MIGREIELTVVRGGDERRVTITPRELVTWQVASERVTMRPMQPLPLDRGRALRPVASNDLDELYALVLANQEHLAPWMPWAADPQREGTEHFLTTAQEQAARDDGVQFAITQSRRIVGIAGFHHVDRLHGATSIGYWLDARCQGRGTATLAVAALVDHAFGVWNLHRVELRAAVGNARSRAIAERLGFVREGVHRHAERVGDRYLDLVVYSVLADEWTARRGYVRS
jgi:ribosomal-protein-serine acetyltransferase